MVEPLAVEVLGEQRIVLQAIALGGILGRTPEEVAAYLITRSLDDMLRSGVIRLAQEEATPNG